MSREELIQQNISRASSAASAKGSSSGIIAPRSTQGTSPSIPSHRTRFGANLDVVEKLQSVVFQPGSLGDGAMRGARAYIRKWKRAGTEQVVPTQPLTTTPGGSAPLVDTVQSYSFKVSEKVASLAWSGDVNFSASPAALSQPTNLTNPFNSSSSNSRVNNLTTTLPQVTRVSPINQQPSQQSTNRNTLRLGLNALSAFGPLRSANPWGTLVPWASPFTVTRSTLIPDGLDGKSRNSARRASWGTGSWQTNQAPSEFLVGEELWQFMFNPSELEIEAGPDYKSAETWGVSDKANSGQPLHWSHNKNVLLKFNSVILNGYAFGKQVEDLEQGIYALFMERDGDSQDGPHVLEFVWGDKIFGPCVIQNINIKEKQWDNGLVVNAEVSFTLEQIPEWVVNDGFVDVARPGRLPLVGAQSSTSTAAPATTPAPAPASTAAPSTTPPPKPQTQRKTTPPPLQTSNDKGPRCDTLKRAVSDLSKISSSPNVLGMLQAGPDRTRERFKAYSDQYALVDRNRFYPITAATQQFSPARLALLINNEWEKRQRLDQRYRNTPKNDLPWGDHRYPSDYANSLLSTAVGSLSGHITQTQLSVCPR